MVPAIPVSVWDQIGVVVVFAFLMAGLGYVVVKVFTKSIADINAHYAVLLKDTNHQWQIYFDARTEASTQISHALTDRMDQIGEILGQLVKDFERHDLLESEARARVLQEMPQSLDSGNDARERRRKARLLRQELALGTSEVRRDCHGASAPRNDSEEEDGSTHKAKPGGQ
jgi:hypothetical protein